ncbi:MAG: hypothetical protein EBV07_00900, partial [Proteobacteria bacterium]|nr:hypothetical protein [Pseudomonadota bacterium]
MQKIKNLLKEEKYKDIFKIIVVLIFYLVIFGIFKSGLDYQKIIQPKNIKEPEKINEYEYQVIDNGKISKLKFNNKKSITQLLDSYFNQNIETRILREGFKIDSIYGRKVSKLEINSKEINPDLLSSES